MRTTIGVNGAARQVAAIVARCFWKQRCHARLRALQDRCLNAVFELVPAARKAQTAQVSSTTVCRGAVRRGWNARRGLIRRGGKRGANAETEARREAAADDPAAGRETRGGSCGQAAPPRGDSRRAGAERARFRARRGAGHQAGTSEPHGPSKDRAGPLPTRKGGNTNRPRRSGGLKAAASPPPLRSGFHGLSRRRRDFAPTAAALCVGLLP